MNEFPNIAVLKFDKPQVLATCFLMFNNIFSLTILILFTIIIHKTVYDLNITFNFLSFFVISITKLM